MDYIDEKIKEIKDRKAQLEGELEELIRPIGQQLAELDLVLEAIEPFSTIENAKVVELPLADLRGAVTSERVEDQKRTRKAGKKYQSRIPAFLAKGPMEYRELVRKLGGGTSAYRAIATLHKLGKVKVTKEGDHKMVSLIKTEVAA